MTMPPKSTRIRTSRRLVSVLLLLFWACASSLDAPEAKAAQPQQKVLPPPSATAPHRTRLILKDGSYQIIMSYRVVGSLVYYISAERGGAEEEIPANFVDFEATKRWDQQHLRPAEGDSTTPPGIDPEVLKEEAETRLFYSPLVAPDLHLPEDYGVLALDTFQSMPELVPLWPKPPAISTATLATASSRA